MKMKINFHYCMKIKNKGFPSESKIFDKIEQK